MPAVAAAEGNRFDMNLVHGGLAPADLEAGLRRARRRLVALCETLPHDRWIGPYAPTVNPPLWELGHIAWFQEHWCLRLKPHKDPRASPLLEPLLPARRPWADWLYDSSRIPHAARWRAPLPSPDETLTYAEEVLCEVSTKLAGGAAANDLAYYAELSLYHELMHIEAWWMNWQAFGLAPPQIPSLRRAAPAKALAFGAGSVVLGSARDAGFVFDNEKWAHEVSCGAFEIDAQPVSCGAFAEFVGAGAYARPELWCAEGRRWLEESGASHPLYWRKAERLDEVGSSWEVRRFDRWIALDPGEPMMHVSRFEAQAYCTWRERQLPSAVEWLRACADPRFARGLCWEWTRDMFAPYPAFSPDPYADYSLPWFHTHVEVRGAGSWVTDPALARPTYRNFYTPERRDPFIGFRTVRPLA